MSEFYRVSGERKEFVFDKEKGSEVATGKMLSHRTRFECLDVTMAQNFATDVYRREGVICEIHEIKL